MSKFTINIYRPNYFEVKNCNRCKYRLHDKNKISEKLRKTLNYTLKHVMERSVDNEFPVSGWKQITTRHTAFRLTLDEDLALAILLKINSFADKDHTSPD